MTYFGRQKFWADQKFTYDEKSSPKVCIKGNANFEKVKNECFFVAILSTSRWGALKVDNLRLASVYGAYHPSDRNLASKYVLIICSFV